MVIRCEWRRIFFPCEGRMLLAHVLLTVLTELALPYHPSIASPVVSGAVYLCFEIIVSIYFILCVSLCFRFCGVLAVPHLPALMPSFIRCCPFTISCLCFYVMQSECHIEVADDACVCVRHSVSRVVLIITVNN